MEVNFSTEVGDVTIDCPFCNGEGYYYVVKPPFIKTKEHVFLQKKEYLERDCPLCKGSGQIEVYVGEVEVSGDVDYEPDHSWRD